MTVSCLFRSFHGYFVKMAEKKDEKVKNEVHENKIWIERVTKEKYNAKLTTVCNPNPR